jgi:hypothetical protein
MGIMVEPLKTKGTGNWYSFIVEKEVMEGEEDARGERSIL